jgi:hypothetical protein
VALDGWDIDPTKVQTIVSTASGRTDSFEKDFPALGTEVSGISDASKSGVVMEALNGWAEKTVQPGLESVGGRLQTTFQGTMDAVNAYVTGDAQMAGDAQDLIGTMPEEQDTARPHSPHGPAPHAV